MQDDKTSNFNIVKVAADNIMRDEDVPRLRQAMDQIDAILFQCATKTELTALVGGAPSSLNTLAKIASSIGNDATFSSTVLAGLAAKADIANLSAVAFNGLYSSLLSKPTAFPPTTATASVIGGVKPGSGLTVDGAGSLSMTAATTSAIGGVKIGQGLSVQLDGSIAVTSSDGSQFNTQYLVPSSAGQTTFVVPGGYVPGALEVLLNGVELIPGGEDYTASNGSTIILANGVQVTDRLHVRRWTTFAVANTLQRSGDTLTGALNEAQAGDLSGTATLDLSGALGNLVNVSGTATISTIVLGAGAQRVIQFTGASTLVHSGGLLLPGNQNIVTESGDVAVFRGFFGGIVRCIGYTSQAGAAYKDLPQIIVSADRTVAASDVSKHWYHPASDTAPRTWTIPANSSVPLKIGTVITFVNAAGAGAITIAINSDTMRLAGQGTTGNRLLSASGMATALKVTATEWLISGSGLS